MIDSYPLEWEASLKEVLAMDWERLIRAEPVRMKANKPCSFTAPSQSNFATL
jgi:hypothetical protein